jgi:hypothetical protein
VGSGDDDNGGDGNSDVDTDGVFISKTPTTATATEKTWTATIPKNTLSEDEAALTLFASNNADYNSGVVSVECGATCTGPTKGLALDRNYIVAEKGVPGVPASVDLGKSPDCTSTPKFTTATVGSTVDLTGCVLDAFGAGVDSENVNWELTNSATPGGSFVGTPDFVTDASGNANASVTSSSGAAGSTTTITFCDDPSQTGDCATAGGANGGVGSKTFRINWTTGVSHARTVSLKLKDSLRARGHVSVTDGFSACADTVPVKIQKRGGGGWHTVKNTHTNATGGYKTKLKNKHGRYRALAPQTTASGDTCLKAHSPTRKH